MTSSFFFNDTATTEIYTLSLHDALPIYRPDFLKRVVPQARLLDALVLQLQFADEIRVMDEKDWTPVDRKSTRLNSSHGYISYAVFCLKKKKETQTSRADSTDDQYSNVLL